MLYPLASDAIGYALRWPAATLSPALSVVRGMVFRHWGVLAALTITFAVHVSSLSYYFDGDDFVVLGSVEYLGARDYVSDSIVMRDIVPNWRPLTAAVYAAEWELFGLNATAWRATHLGVHIGSVALLYALVLRATRRPAAGAIAAVIFGVSGAHFDTVNYVTALPHLLSTFFVLGSLYATVSYADGGERRPALYWGAFGLFALAFFSNEGAFVFAPVIVAAYALFSDRWRRSPQRLVLHAGPFAAVAVGWLSFYESCSCEQLKFEGYRWGPHAVENYAVYLSFIGLPFRNVPLEPTAGTWAVAAGVVGVSALTAARGGRLAAVGVLGMGIALLPYVPVSIWTASRYTYTAVAFFAPVAAIASLTLYDAVRRSHRYARIPATVAGLAAVATVAALYSWQTTAQHARSGRHGERWELLASELRRNHETVPAGTTIYIVDGPWTNPMEQYTWVPSVARALYGDAAAFDLPRTAYETDPPTAGRMLFLEWTGVGLRPVEAAALLGAAERSGDIVPAE